MDSHTSEIKQTATTLLSALLSNPHIYPQTSVEGGGGQMEQKLVILAVDMAEQLINHVEKTNSEKTSSEISH